MIRVGIIIAFIIFLMKGLLFADTVQPTTDNLNKVVEVPADTVKTPQPNPINPIRIMGVVR